MKIEIWPSILLHGHRDTKHGGSVRLWALAMSLDHTPECDHANKICKGGSGKVKLSDLKAAAISLKVSKSSFYHWLADARACGLLSGNHTYLYYANQGKAAKICMVSTIDKSKSPINIKALFKQGWQAVIWAAYLKANHHKNIGYNTKMQRVYKGRVVSEKTLEDLTGVPSRTQQRLKKHLTIKHNVAITKQSGSRESAATMQAAALDHGKRRHYFPFNDTRQKDPAGLKSYRRVIAHTLPARRTVSDNVAGIGAFGRKQQIQKYLSSLAKVCNYPSSFSKEQGPAKTEQPEKRYFPNHYYRKPTRKPQALPVPSDPGKEAFIQRSRRSRVHVWDRVEVAE